MSTIRNLAVAAALLTAVTPMPVRADTYASRSCENVRRDNPGLTAPIHFACLRWVERGNTLHRYLTAKVTHYYCAPLDGAKDSRIVDMVDYAANPGNCDNPHATLHPPNAGGFP